MVDENTDPAAQENETAIFVDRQEQEVTLSDEEDAQFVVQEDKTLDPISGEDQLPAVLSAELNSEDRGGLVRNILQTKKELEGSASKQKLQTTTTTTINSSVTSAQQQKERQLVYVIK